VTADGAAPSGLGTDAAAPFRILAIDGGGIRGFLPARLLQELEKRAGKPIAEMFDLIAGTSTGGILACGLARRIPAERIGQLYVQHGLEIFNHSLAREIGTADGLLGARYSADALESLLQDVLGEARLSDVAAPHLLVPSYCIALPAPVTLAGSTAQSSRAPMFFKSWRANGRGPGGSERAAAFDFRLWQVARATSAAPTYFPPAVIESMSGDRYAMIDGGVFANNPSLCAVAAARRLRPAAERLLLVSLGTGVREKPIDAADAWRWGDAEWLRPILAVLMDGAVDVVCYIAEQLLGSNHHRIEAAITGHEAPSAAFDDASADNLRRLEALAQRMIAAESARLDRLCRELVR
jgi:patatin-like phospholipase/acyl hydrolase